MAVAILVPREVGTVAIVPEPEPSAAPSRVLQQGHSWYLRAKPPIDRSLAALGIAVCAPGLLVVGLLVMLDSPGPVFYRQMRVGRDRRSLGSGPYTRRDRRRRNQGGQPFRIWKFRTMRTDAEAATGPVWAQGDADPRVTRFGRFLRASHLDELAQLFNVVRGDMSLVGPRPERPEFFVGLAAEVPNYGIRTRVRPGITGLAQVRHKYDENLDDVRRKVELDLQYIGKVGLRTDVKILLGTVRRCWYELRQAVERRSAPRSTSPAPARS